MTPDELNTPLLDADRDFVDEDHIDAFENALLWEHDGTYLNSLSTTSSLLPNTTGEVHEGARTEKITLKSDWYPVSGPSKSGTTSLSKHSGSRRKSLLSKRAKKAASTAASNNSKLTDKVRDEFRSSFAYTILRWPILIFTLTWIWTLTLLYTCVRAYVALSEYFFTWTGQRRKIREKLRATQTYQEWINTAIELDEYLGLDKWSKEDKFSYYDYKTIRLTISRLKRFRTERRDQDMLVLLQGCLKKNFAGIENRQLYSHRYYGTKNLVSEYNELVVECIDYIIESQLIDNAAKRKFFKFVLKNYGKSALCLSGGACFAYIHFGIVKALLDNDLMPRIISGTSGGGLIAALACTRTDEELKKLIIPKLATKITACEDPWYVWLPRWWQTGARFDLVSWARKANFFTRGSTTFQEAYKRTGRRLNILTVPNDPHSPVILCNSVTSPNCIIWSSLLASSAVPGILNPVVLMMKNPHDEHHVEPFSLGSKWRDGSLRTDIPLDALNTYYNVNFSVVSQVNPHILLFFFAPKGTVGRPVATTRRLLRSARSATFRGGFILTALEQLLKLEITKWLKIIKTLDLLPHLLEQDWLNIWLQRFSGSITIWPKIKLKDFYYLLSDPTESQLAEMITKGEKCMYPCILFIKHRLSIERAIERGRETTKRIDLGVGTSKPDFASTTENEIEEDALVDSDIESSDDEQPPIDPTSDQLHAFLPLQDEEDDLDYQDDDDDDDDEGDSEDDDEDDLETSSSDGDVVENKFPNVNGSHPDFDMRHRHPPSS